MAKKVFLYAYDKVNLGDDLFIRFITSRYPDCEFTMISNKVNIENFKDIKNLNIIDENSTKINIMNKIHPSLFANYQHKLKMKSDAVCYIGGSIFMEGDTWNDVLNWWDFQVNNYPFYVLGANIGPYKTEEYRKKMGIVFSKLKGICFRDRYSYELFSDIKSARVAPDILFGQKIPEVIEKKKQVFVSVVNCENKSIDDIELRKCNDDYYNWLKIEIDNALKKGYDVKLSSFCKSEGDEEICNRLQADFSDVDCSSKVECLFYNGRNHVEVLREIASSSTVVSARFHGIILALISNVPVLPVSYSIKTINVLKDMGFTGRIQNIKNIDNSCHFTDATIDINICVDKLIEKSEEHFMKLDTVLK